MQLRKEFKKTLIFINGAQPLLVPFYYLNLYSQSCYPRYIFLADHDRTLGPMTRYIHFITWLIPR